MWASVFAIVVTAIVMVVVVAASLSVACCRRSNAVQDDLEAAPDDNTTGFSSTPQVSKPPDAFYSHRHPHVLARDELKVTRNHTSVNERNSDFDSTYLQLVSNYVNVASPDHELQNVAITDNIPSSPVEQYDECCRRSKFNAVQDADDLESVLCSDDGTSLSSKPAVNELSSIFHRHSPPHVEIGESIENVDLHSSSSTDNSSHFNEEDSLHEVDFHVSNMKSPLPNQLHKFINKTVIPSFKGQRASKQYQFAVLLLLSENDYNNITKISFDPCDRSGQPLLDDGHPVMPNNASSYGNYVVARPIDNCNHSEEEIFGKYSNSGSPFTQLWNAYINNNGAIPSCVLLYSWNLPCSRCTDVIIRAFEESPYNQTKVIVVHTTFWRSETNDKKNTKKLTIMNITVENVICPVRIPAKV